MKFSAARILPTLITILAPAVAVAQEHGAAAGEHGAANPIPSVKEGLVVGLASLVVFGIVFAILSTQVWPKISKALDARAQKIRSEIEAAEQAQRQAKDALAQYEKNLADARAEAQRMLNETKAQQAALAADLRSKADAELAIMRDKARRDIEAAKRAAINELYSEAAGLATNIAGKILQREVKPADQQRLVQESLAELQNVSRN